VKAEDLPLGVIGGRINKRLFTEKEDSHAGGMCPLAGWRAEPERIAFAEMGSTPLTGKLAGDCLARGLGQSEERGTGAPVDLAYLARFTLGNIALEREVLQLFAAQMPLYVEALSKARVRKAWREAAHSIKGSASAIGAWRLAGCAQFAERVEVDGELAAPEAEREKAVVGVARAAEEACRFIGRRLASS
jgi:HPt (histidine-containing phosphotransfer) domain-containing protein